MKRPKFTKEQLDWLRSILKPSCCHVSGEHDPKHFEEQPKRICYIQKYKAYDKAMKALRFAPMTGIPEDECGWCEDRRKRLSGGK